MTNMCPAGNAELMPQEAELRVLCESTHPLGRECVSDRDEYRTHSNSDAGSNYRCGVGLRKLTLEVDSTSISTEGTSGGER